MANQIYRGGSVPAGYLVGRPASGNKGKAPAQLIRISDVVRSAVSQSPSGGGSGGGSPGGSGGQIQYNSMGSFGGFTASGDATVNTGTGAITFATVNSNVGTYASVTINGKGLATAGAALSGDLTTSGSVATLATVNSDTGTINGVTTNAKGLVTANVSQGYLTANQTVTLSGAVTGSGTTAITAVIPCASGDFLVGNGSGDATAVGMSGDATLANTGAVTLASVNSDTGTINGVTTNAKGLVTANVSQGYLTANQTVTLSGDTTGSGTTAITTTTGSVNGNTFPASAGYTSGGVLYASSTSAVASSALLASGGLVVGGGAGAAPSTNADFAITSSILVGNKNSAAVPSAAGGGGPIFWACQADGANGSYLIDTFGAGVSRIIFRNTGGTNASPSAVASGTPLGQFNGAGYTGSGYFGSCLVTFVASENWSSTASGSQMELSVTTNTTQTNLIALQLNNDGGLLVPSTVTGASKGSGTVNATSGYYIKGSNILTGKAATNTTAASPGTITSTNTMLGLGGTITTAFNTKALVTICGSVSNGTLADGGTLTIAYGTGGAPSNKGAAAGTNVGAAVAWKQAVAGDATPFSVTAVVPVTAGTATWLDLNVGVTTGGTITFGSTNVAAIEI